jgi:hypothetical protein
MSALVVIVAIHDMREKKTENELKNTKALWIFGALPVHIAWGLMKIAK